LDALLTGSSIEGGLGPLVGRTVLVATRDQLTAALALIELDGIARRLIVCTPDLAAQYLPYLVTTGQVDAVVFDDGRRPGLCDVEVPLRVRCTPAIAPATIPAPFEDETEWVLLTSGTTGAPKLVRHTLASLTAPIVDVPRAANRVVWATFYDIRRYGGMQILLRALLGGASLILSNPDESPADFLGRMARHGATHVTGTPSHWRRALMSPQARAIAPRYVRLSGEIADQAILNALHACYPEAGVGHAYASTEAGVAFDVNDGVEGFPASVLRARPEVEIKIEDGSIRIRSPRTATTYLGPDPPAISDADGFVDTGDMVERRGDRYYFLGRRTGVVNIGGLKVYPEEVEAVINRHHAVRMSIVRARRSRITGALVAADVVLKDGAVANSEPDATSAIKTEIMRACRASLAPHKVPATIRFVPSLEVAAAGKLARNDA
jgi:acyl-coenzyme A synthetase/AMP-(fatty) acid ligase